MLRLLMLASLLVVSSPALAVDAAKATRIVADMSDRFVPPVYLALKQSAGTTREQVEQLCAAPSEDALAGARAGFRTLLDFWSRAEPVRFGPVAEDNRLEKLLYWPDRKSIGLKQVQEALATGDPTVESLATLQQKSVALQGLGTLEFLLFGTGSETLAKGDDHRCLFAHSVALNVEQLTTAVESEWTGAFSRTWTAPGEGNGRYRTADEALTEVLNTLIHGLEMVRDVRLGGFLAETADKDRPRLAIWWRSGMTTESIRANLDSLRQLFELSDLEDLLPEESRWIARSIAFEFENASKTLAAMSGPVDDILKDPVQRDKL
ncbi:MAG: imelysin family protein, partial [Mesorhizobium sp.]